MASTATDVIDGVSSSVSIKAPVRVATTANVATNGLFPVDDVMLVDGDRYLRKNQTNPVDNGIFIASTSEHQRAADFDGNRDVVKGTTVLVNSGTANGNKAFSVSTNDPIVIGTSSISFQQTPTIGGDASAISYTVSGGSTADLDVALDAHRVASMSALVTGTWTGIDHIKTLGFYAGSYRGGADFYHDGTTGGTPTTNTSSAIITALATNGRVISADGKGWIMQWQPGFRHVDQFGAGPSSTVADSGPSIAAAIASLPSGGTAYGGVIQFGQGLYVSANTKISVPNGVWLRGEGPAATQLRCGNSFSQTALVTNTTQDGTQEFAFVSDMLLDGNKGGGAVCSTSVLDLVSLFVNSAVYNVVVIDGSAYGLRISASGTGSGGGGPVLIDNCWVKSCNDHNIYLHADGASSNAAANYYLHRVTSEHQASGKSAIYIQGNGKLNLVSCRDIHIEQANTGAGTRAITLDGAADFILDGAQIQSASSGTGSIVITNSVYNLRYKLNNITNINVISPLIDDQKESVQRGAGDHVPWHASSGFGIYQDRTQTLTYGTTVNTDVSLGNYCILVATNTTAFTIANPTNAQVGERITYEIVNSSGGAMGTITWGANFVYRDPLWANPASTKRRTISFRLRASGAWVQDGAFSGDM